MPAETAVTDVDITPDLVRAVRDAVDIVSIASEYTRLKRSGKRYQGLCPFHKEKTPSFSVDPDQGLYYCFGCGAGGDAIKLHMEQSGDDFPAAIESLAQRHGIPLPKKRGVRRASEPDLTGALEAAAEFFRHALSQSDAARRYLTERRIEPELAERYGLGYAPDSWDALRDALGSRVPMADLIAAGLVGRSEKSGKPYDRFRHRLIFPVHALGGRLLGFGGRTLGDDRAKYVNTAETAYFHKGSLLYGIHQAKRALRDAGRALLVEGYFDVLGAVAADVPWAVAGMGTALTGEQARLLARFVDEVVVGYDADEAGEKAFERALPLLLDAGLTVRRARFPDGHDPDSLRLEAGPESVRAAVDEAEDGVWLLIRRRIPPPGKRAPADKRRAAIQIVEVLRLVRDPLIRRAYVQRAAEHLGVPEDLLFGRLNPELERSDPAATTRGRVVRSREEQALVALLNATPPPPADRLPPPEIFFDPGCRNIYRAFCAIYQEGGPRAPEVDQILARLHDGSGEASALDSAARLLVEGAVPDGEGSSETPTPADNELSEILSQLERRWWKQCQVDLVQQIREALSRGDEEKARQLREKKNALTHSLHPDATGELG